ncbi:MAG TPA: TerC family protein, partial [Gemmataceae bacterium]|nr:TerC family protein [Gemmataceae bacterium]
MPRRLPTVTLSVGLAVVLFAVFGSARGDNVAPAVATDDGIKIQIEPTAGGPAVEGTLKMPAVTLKTGTDERTIEWKHIRRVTLQKDPTGTALDSVQMADKSIVRGRVTQDTFVVKTDGTEKTFTRAEMREVRPVRTEKISLLTILLGLLTLTAMEIILGVDNVIFLTIVTSKLPPDQRPQARRFGLGAALGTRLLLLLFLSFILGLTKPVLTLPELGFLHDMEAREVSWRDIILLAGGLFLIGKSVLEMHKSLEHAKEEFGEQQPEPAAGGTGPPPVLSAADAAAKRSTFVKTIITIAVIDIVFSLDSVITAVGMV